MITSRFNEKIPLVLILGSIISFATSLFFMQLFLGILSILWLFEKTENKKKAFDKTAILILIFGAVRILSILFSEYFSISVETFYKEALFYFAFFSLTYYLKIFDKKKLIFITGFFIIAAAVISLTGIVQFNLRLVRRAESFSSGYNTYSTFLLAGLGFGLTFASGGIKNFWKYKVLANSVILTGIITSLGRTNIAIAVLFLIAALLFRKIKISTLAAIIILTAAFSLISFYNNNSKVTQRVDSITQLSDRDILYEGAKEIMFEHPFLGFGPRTFHQVFPFPDQLMDRKVGGWHNDFIQIYFESGLLGLLSFVTLLGFIVYFSFKTVKQKNNEQISGISYGILFSICGFILTTITAGFITSVVLSIVFVYIISVLSALSYLKKTKRSQENI